MFIKDNKNDYKITSIYRYTSEREKILVTFFKNLQSKQKCPSVKKNGLKGKINLFPKACDFQEFFHGKGREYIWIILNKFLHFIILFE